MKKLRMILIGIVLILNFVNMYITSDLKETIACGVTAIIFTMLFLNESK